MGQDFGNRKPKTGLLKLLPKKMLSAAGVTAFDST